MQKKPRIAILGAGNIGTAIAKGLTRFAGFRPQRITLTRRKVNLLREYSKQGFSTTKSNPDAIRESDIVIIAVEPSQIDGVLKQIGPYLDPTRQIVVSVVTGVTIGEIRSHIGKVIPVVRAMPNTGVSIGESITCLAGGKTKKKAVDSVRKIFDLVGRTLLIDEEQMTASTALGACGVAFFLRAIRAASQGGIEIGFHADDALTIAAQTAKGAASLLLNMENHPEFEIDRVTTPRGCTIAGLNQMEHEGFSSAMIKGIVTSCEKAGKLY